MPDGNPIIIGQANTASNPGDETILTRNEDTYRSVFVARNLNQGHGIRGEAYEPIAAGVRGDHRDGPGVHGDSYRGTGVRGSSQSWYGVRGESDNWVGVRGESKSDIGVWGTSGGTSDSGVGVYGSSTSSTGVRGVSTSGIGVTGTSGGIGVRATCTSEEHGFGVFAEGGVAGLFAGSVAVQGDLTVWSGNKAFKIDHPLDPQNKYLLHNAVEAPERKNVYDGVARLDKDGATWVELPEWFEALNGDFRYQLTAVGGAAPNLHVAEEVSENRFKIAGGQEGMRICWQLTGTRKDPWAAANPFEVEQEKPAEERGRYLEPGLYDAPEEQRVMIGPPIPEAVEEEQRPPEPSGIDFARLEEAHLRQIDELRRLEEEHRREMVELRRRLEEHEEEAPPENT